MKKLKLKIFFRDYPIVPILIVVFSIGVGIGFNLGRKSSGQGKPQVYPSRLAMEEPAEAYVAKAIPANISAEPEKLAQAPREANIISFPFFPFKRPPRIAFVIDDVGNSKHFADALFSFPKPITIAILPQLAYSKYFAEEGKKHGLETMLHLPLEPDDRIYKPGAGEIKTTMSENEIKEVLAKNLESVPGVSGVNNHMGSRATRNSRLMSVVLKELKEHGLFFLDSMTHPNSIAYEKARDFGLKTIKRDVFIDNKNNYDYVREQIKQAAEVAKANGFAVAIGHVHDNTLRALKDAMPELEADGIELVRLGDLL